MMERLTLDGPVECAGVGLFTAKPAKVTLLPATGPTGFRIRRTDAGVPEAARAWFEVHAKNLQPMPNLPGRNTVLGVGGAVAITTEHVLSALAGLRITDCDIELEGPEFPMFDGSSADYVDAIDDVGTLGMEIEVAPLTITAPVTVRSGNATITATPRTKPGCTFTYELDYSGVQGAEGIRPQSAVWDGTPEAYRDEIAPARTYCLIHEAQALRQAGLFRHVTPEDMLVLDRSGKPVDNELHFDDEPARHKLLDLIGDLVLVGRPIQADIVATRAGHALNHEMAKALLSAAEVRG